jgi:hypothetical protein
MNIFYLSKHHDRIVRYMVDSHIVKMPTESAQMLSTAVRLGGVDSGYKITHENHPCNVWVRKSLSNWLWLRELVCHMNAEWRYRYEHDYDHRAYTVAQSLPIPDIPDIGLTKVALCMPDEYKQLNAVQAYREFYIMEKAHLHRWRKRKVPSWISNRTLDADSLKIVFCGGRQRQQLYRG